MIKIGRILVTTDFSQISLSGLRYAFSLARDHGAEVIVLHAIPDEVVNQMAFGSYGIDETFLFSGTWTSPIRLPDLDALVRKKRLNLYNLLQEKMESGLLKLVKVTPLVRLGGVVEEIVATAKEKKSDLIVMTSRERSWLGRLFSRSLTHQVVRLAPCPVLSIQPWARVRTEKGQRIPLKLLGANLALSNG